MTIDTLKKLFADGKIEKADFIQKCYEVHDGLFQYGELLSETEIEQITIRDDGVSFTMKPFGLILDIPRRETRVAPLEALNFNKYEPEVIPVFDVMVDNATTLLDVGANIGYLSVRSAVRQPNVMVHAFEPQPTSYEYLQRNVAKNGLSDRIRCHGFGLSDTNGAVTFFSDPLNGVNTSLLNVANAANPDRIVGLVMRLDDWCANAGCAPDLLKCDVEGAEFLVLKGGRRTLETVQPMILAEMLRKWSEPFGYHPNDMIGYLKQLGYDCYGLGLANGGDRGLKLSQILQVDEETRETNYVFLHTQRHASTLSKIAEIAQIVAA